MNALKTSGQDQVYASMGNLMDSKTNQLDDILIEKLENAFHKTTSKIIHHDLAKIAIEHSPIDLAYAAPRLPAAARIILFANLPDQQSKIDFIVNVDSDSRVAILRDLKDDEVKKMLNQMPPDEAVYVIEDLSERRLRKMLQLLDIKKGLRIKELIKHERNTAGRIMSNEFFAFPMDMTIEQAAKLIRDNPGIDFTRSVFVLNQAGELQGYVPARNLLINPTDIPLRQVMRPILHKVSPEATRDEVVDVVERYKIPALPVVDVDNFLVGVITYEDVVELMEDIADETIAKMAGTGEKMDSYQHGFKRFAARAPWLLATLIAGLVNMEVMQYYNQHISSLLTFLLFFVPLINGLSGNIGLQCSTVIVRGMAVGTLTMGNKRSIARKELILGMMTGLVFGVLCAIVVYILNVIGLQTTMGHPLSVGIIIGGGLISACVAGTVLGVFAPLVFASLGVDPAIASGPIITAFNDFLSMTIYFMVAVFLSSFLI